MKTLLVQHDIAWEDKPTNHRCVRAMLDEARPSPGTLVLLPELFDTGFSMNLTRIVDEDVDAQSGPGLPPTRDSTSTTTGRWCRQVAADFEIRLLAGHAEFGADGRGRNCLSAFDGCDGGRRVATYRKVHPFSHGREGDHYSGGERIVLIEVDGATVAPMICYDLRFPELWRLAAAAGAEVFALAANWPAARQSHWRALCIARAVENQAFVLAVNRTGGDPKIRYTGGSLIVDPKGNLLLDANDEPKCHAHDVDIDALRSWRREFPALDDLHRELLGTITVDRVVISGSDCGESAHAR